MVCIFYTYNHLQGYIMNNLTSTNSARLYYCVNIIYDIFHVKSSFSLPKNVVMSAVCEVLNLFTYEWPHHFWLKGCIILYTPLYLVNKVLKTYVTKINAHTFKLSRVLITEQVHEISEVNTSQLCPIFHWSLKTPYCGTKGGCIN